MLRTHISKMAVSKSLSNKSCQNGKYNVNCLKKILKNQTQTFWKTNQNSSEMPSSLHILVKRVGHIQYHQTQILCFKHRNYSTNKGYTVTVLDATHRIGRHLALMLKQCPMINELRLYDQNNSVCCIAEDLSHIDTCVKVKSYCGIPVLKHAVTDADIVITVGGCRRTLSESTKSLFNKNIDDIRLAAMHCIEFAPKSLVCIAKPPVEAFVPLVSEEYKRAGVYDCRKIIGLSSVVCMRANTLIGTVAGLDPSEIRCPVIGGPSPKCSVAICSQSRPAKVHQQHHKLVQDSLVVSEDEILKAYGDGGSVCLAPALGIARFINAQLRALDGHTNCVDCAFVKQNGHIGQFLPYMMSIVRLGRHGILSCHMPKVSGFEAHCLKKVSMVLKEHIKLGESFVIGGQAVPNEAIMTPVKEKKQITN